VTPRRFNEWATGWCAGRDLNADGVVNLKDFSEFAQSWTHQAE
jgi:hypothetical protein